MCHSFFAIAAVITLVFGLITGQSYLATDRKFSMVREMTDRLAVVSGRDGKLYFRLANDAACGGDKYFYSDEALYSKHDGTDEPGILFLSTIVDVKSLRLSKSFDDRPMITLEDKAYDYQIVPMHCCFNLFAEKKID